MEFITTSCSDKGKGDQVTITIADEEEQAPTSRPQLMSYLWILYLMSVIFSFILGSTLSIIVYEEKSPLKDDLGWFLLITTIVAVSFTVLASAILVFASCYMKSYMRTSHYTVFKTISSSSGILAHFSLGCFLIFPHIKLNWIAYSVICVIIVEIAVGRVLFGSPSVNRYLNKEKKVMEEVGSIAYKLELPQELSRVHHTFHVSNLKKCYTDEPLAVPFNGFHIEDKLHFIEEPAEIMDQKVKRLKQSRILVVKVRWNSGRGPEFT
ncbi:hypothetical protein Tco_0452582 [Tanacetum coccineum]